MRAMSASIICVRRAKGPPINPPAAPIVAMAPKICDCWSSGAIKANGEATAAPASPPDTASSAKRNACVTPVLSSAPNVLRARSDMPSFCEALLSELSGPEKNPRIASR